MAKDMEKLYVYICWVPCGRATRPAVQCDIKASFKFLQITPTKMNARSTCNTNITPWSIVLGKRELERPHPPADLQAIKNKSVVPAEATRVLEVNSGASNNGTKPMSESIGRSPVFPENNIRKQHQTDQQFGNTRSLNFGNERFKHKYFVEVTATNIHLRKRRL